MFSHCQDAKKRPAAAPQTLVKWPDWCKKPVAPLVNEAEDNEANPEEDKPDQR